MVKNREMYSLANNESDVNVEQVKINELYSFEGHPFKVKRDQELFELRRSIETEGVLVPLLVRNSPYGRGYEIISGHRGKEAALWAGLKEVPVIIRKLDNEQLARMVGESVTQIKRYIRLTKLIPKILDMVDKEMLALRSAVELSFLTEDEQYQLYVIMEWEQAIPNLSQANRLKRMSQQQCLDIDKIYEILQEEKPNRREQIKLPMERIRKYFPENFTSSQQIALIEHLLKEWAETNRK